jgi:hypothetical protein
VSLSNSVSLSVIINQFAAKEQHNDQEVAAPKSTMIVHLFSIALLVLFVSCQQEPAPQNAPQAAASPNTAQWDAYVNEFLNNYFTAHPDAGVLAGRHEFDGKP